jgi:hypothetical protein
MANRTDDWLPQNHEEIYSKAIQTETYLTAAVLARIGIGGAALVWYQNEFIMKLNRFRVAFGNWRNPAERTQIKMTILQEAEKDFVKAYRKFYTGYMKGTPLVTDDDLVSAGFPRRHSGSRHSVKKPSSLIEMRAEASAPATVTIHYQDAGSQALAKPDGVRGGEFVYIIRAAGDPPPVDWSELTNSFFDTRTPLTLTFTGKQRGMILYFASRWENTRGEKGPWNNIRSIIIP